MSFLPLPRCLSCLHLLVCPPPAVTRQLSDSGVSQSKKLEELAEVSDELKRTKAALERAERLVFDQRREGVCFCFCSSLVCVFLAFALPSVAVMSAGSPDFPLVLFYVIV